MDTQIIKARTKSQIAEAAAAGARALKRGKLVAFATETVYGIAAVASRSDAIRRLRELKSRPRNPFSVHLACAGDVRRYVSEIPPDARRMMARSWPGPLTLLLPVGGKLADRKLHKAGLYDVLCPADVIGLRCPDEPVAAAMLAGVKMPVIAPSANLAGAPSPRTAADVITALDGRVDLLIDSGPTRHGKDSTIVKFHKRGWRVVREGVYDERMVRRLLRRKIVFVCTGNTCRSPMAAGIAKKMLSDQLGVAVSSLRGRGVQILSAGLFASGGSGATPEAVSAARFFEANISHHRSRKLTGEMVGSSDMIFCMTGFHVEEVRRMFPSAAEKVCLLDDGTDIPDPIGGGPKVYRKTARQIVRALKRLTEKGLL